MWNVSKTMREAQRLRMSENKKQGLRETKWHVNENYIAVNVTVFTIHLSIVKISNKLVKRRRVRFVFLRYQIRVSGEATHMVKQEMSKKFRFEEYKQIVNSGDTDRWTKLKLLLSVHLSKHCVTTLHWTVSWWLWIVIEKTWEEVVF
jgi:hypothetical protein